MDNFRYNEFNVRPFESHSLVLSMIQNNSKVLEIGSATGYFSEKLTRKNCEVWGVELDKEAAKKSTKKLYKVFAGDVSEIDKFEIKRGYFDYILLQDILEHLTNSEVVLLKIKKYLKHGGKVIISTPNIVHISIRTKVLSGVFEYEDIGIMDRTHVHFFTRKTLVECLKNAGYRILDMKYSTDFGQIPFVGRVLKKIPKHIQYLLTNFIPTLLAIQFVVVMQNDEK